MPHDADSMLEDGRHPGAYRAFLVRCWQEPDAGNGCPVWRFMLVQLDDGQTQHGFASLEDLTAYLNGELSTQRPPGEIRATETETTL